METAGAFPSSPLCYDSTLHFGLSSVAGGLLLEMSSPAAGVKGSHNRGKSLPFSYVIGCDGVFSCNKHASMEVMTLKPGGSSYTIIACGHRKQSFLPFFPVLPSQKEMTGRTTGGCHV